MARLFGKKEWAGVLVIVFGALAAAILALASYMDRQGWMFEKHSNEIGVILTVGIVVCAFIERKAAAEDERKRGAEAERQRQLAEQREKKRDAEDRKRDALLKRILREVRAQHGDRFNRAQLLAFNLSNLLYEVLAGFGYMRVGSEVRKSTERFVWKTVLESSSWKDILSELSMASGERWPERLLMGVMNNESASVDDIRQAAEACVYLVTRGIPLSVRIEELIPWLPWPEELISREENVFRSEGA